MSSRLMLSGVIVAQDNEASIARVLQALRPVVDEIVLVDGGSEDATADIAAASDGVRLYRRPFDGDIARQKNFACDQAHGDWILILDSDELLEEGARESIRGLIERPFQNWYKLPRHWLVQRDGEYHYLRSKLHYPDYQLRLFRNRPPFRYDPGRSPIHHNFPKPGRGRGRKLSAPHIQHYDLILNSREAREAKVARYENIDAGTQATNRMYLWEDEDVELVPLRVERPLLV